MRCLNGKGAFVENPDRGRSCACRDKIAMAGRVCDQMIALAGAAMRGPRTVLSVRTARLPLLPESPYCVDHRCVTRGKRFAAGGETRVISVRHEAAQDPNNDQID